MKDSSTREGSEYCPVCLRPLVNAGCTVCGDLTITPFESRPDRIAGWTCEAIIYRDSREELFRVKKGDVVGLLRRSLMGSHIALKDMDPLSGEVFPVDEGVHEGAAFMVWTWPEATAVNTRGVKPHRAYEAIGPVYDAVLERLERGGTEPQPWEIVNAKGRWGLLAGWERVEMPQELSGSCLAAPERFRGGAPTDSSKVYVHAALLYLLASGRPPLGLLAPPSGNRVNLDPFDIAVARGLWPQVEGRTRRDAFSEAVRHSLGIHSPGKKLLQMAGAALGIGLLLAIGYGLSTLMASL